MQSMGVDNEIVAWLVLNKGLGNARILSFLFLLATARCSAVCTLAIMLYIIPTFNILLMCQQSLKTISEIISHTRAGIIWSSISPWRRARVGMSKVG